MVALRKTQLRIFFEACDLCLDCCKLTLKSRNASPRTWRRFRFLAFHNAPHVRTCHSPLLERCLAIRLAKT